MAGASEIFDERVAVHYEAWYGAKRGRRADAEEKHLLGSLLNGFAGAGTILEVGCGTGHFTRWLGERGLAAVGLDRSSAMLAQADAHDACPFVRADALHLPFANDAFDLVAFITTLEFVERRRDALAEALRVTRKGLVVGALSRWSPLGIWRRVVDLWRRGVYRAAAFFSLRELKRLLRSVAGEEARLRWDRTLYPRGWPRALACGPWGGFIGVAVDVVGDGS